MTSEINHQRNKKEITNIIYHTKKKITYQAEDNISRIIYYIKKKGIDQEEDNRPRS